MEIPIDRKVFETPSSFVWFDDEGFLCSLTKKRETALTLGEAKAVIEEMKKITGNKKVCLLSENRHVTIQPSKEVRKYIAGEIPKITKAWAAVVYNPLSRMIVNLFFALYPPSYPAKMFTDEKKAREWLSQFKDPP